MLSLAVASLAVWTSTGPCEVVGTCVHSSGYPLNYGAKESSARGLAGERKGSGTPRKGSAREVQGTAGLLRQYSEQI